ncbi:glycosyltransferase [Butyrivibrio sp. INlla16]|uniref:glycosyltransferase family 2 protein n=1 Tax=Butyrivibrio sp. INlla16 TaxID=1520807 RepID=UPI00089268FA|nr:glycosyltransferase [Butyrivibrio sp. INlla16]SDB62978.1 Glycosyl transferase family 2 [Butyrivibrio sp. INlla16]
MKISVIIPVYNIEKYITNCLQSVEKQEGFTDYEVIMVDDGSTDKSGKICDQYALKNDCFRVFHKANGGLSAARNYGVSVAQGEYLLFLDGDDYIEPNAFVCFDELLNKEGREFDVVIAEGNYVDKNGNNTLLKIFSIDAFDKISTGSGQSSPNGIQTLKYTLPIACNWAAWGKYIRKDYWTENDFSFVQGRNSEDMQLIDRVLLKADKVGMVPSFIHYRLREGSIVRTISEKNVMDIMDNLVDWENFFKSKSIDIEIVSGIRHYLSNSFLHSVMAQIYRIPKCDRNLVLKRAQDMRGWIIYEKSKDGDRVRRIERLIGFKASCFILCLAKQIRRKLHN